MRPDVRKTSNLAVKRFFYCGTIPWPLWPPYEPFAPENRDFLLFSSHLGRRSAFQRFPSHRALRRFFRRARYFAARGNADFPA
jgi:hypothetical protein